MAIEGSAEVSNDRIAITVKFDVMGIDSHVRRTYRHWRYLGLDRYETNLLISGLVMGRPDLGELHIGKVSRQGD
jgi:hypothetical protein